MALTKKNLAIARGKAAAAAATAAREQKAANRLQPTGTIFALTGPSTRNKSQQRGIITQPEPDSKQTVVNAPWNAQLNAALEEKRRLQEKAD